MKVQDKLELFSKTAVSEAEKKSLDVYNKLEAEYKLACQKAEKAANLDGEQKVRHEEQKARLAYNRAVLAARTNAKRSLSAYKNELIEQLFIEVRERLEEYVVNDSGYIKDLRGGIAEVAARYGAAEITVYLTRRDMARVTVPAGVTVLEASDAVIGGFKAQIAGMGVMIDGFYSSLLEKEKRDFEGIE